MPKGRFTSLDVRCAVRDMRAKLIGKRIGNIYDINGRTYLLKLAQSGVESDKLFIVIESGVRIHSTTFSRDRKEVPSIFTMKLRKAVRTKRLEDIRQLGYDRVVDMTFGSGDGEFHIIVEFYAAGNIILTDKNYKIETLLRSYKLDDGTNVAIGEVYPATKFFEFPTIASSQLHECIKDSGAEKLALKEALVKRYPIGAELVEHCILEAGLNPKSKCEEFDIEASLVPLWNQFQEVSKFVADPERSKGFVTWKENKNPATTLSNGQVLEVNKDDVLYDAFIPKLFKQFVDTPKMEFEDFDAAADEFFSKIESQKIEVQRSHQENSVVKKLDKVKEDQNKRIKALEDQEDKWERYASLIEQNVHAVDAAINAVNSYLEKQIQWTQLTDMVKQLKKQGDPIASLIHKMDLLKSKVTLLLYDTITAEEDLELEAEQVTVDLKLTAHANATEYYAQKKKAAEKKQKTMESARHALKSAEKTAISQLKEVKMKASIQKLRKPYWFERFNWFVSSDGYIVVSGRDMQQNELLYKRYLQKGDAYIHAEVHGASTCIVKNPSGAEIPPRTLSEAGTLSICMSKAWKNKIVTSAWWVNDTQVSKTAPSGEYLSTGSFMIRGKKNFLPPSNLVMGFGLLFRLADESIPAHLRDETTDKDSREEKEAKKQEHERQQQENHEVNTSPTVDLQEVTEDAHEPSELPEDANAGEECEEREEDEESDNEDDEDEDEEELRLSSSVSISVVRQDEEPAAPVTAEATSSEQPTSGPTQTDERGGKKRVSAAARRAIKKGADPNVPKGSSPAPAPKKKGQAPVSAPRGKKGKLKKMQTKYADQDDEEREAALRLLKSAGTEKQSPVAKAGAVAAAKKQTEADKLAEQRQKRQKQQEIEAKRIAKEREEEEIRNLMREEKLEMLSEQDMQKLKEMSAKGLGVNLSALTAKPKEGDILLYAIPVCAPYDALSEYKYKVKITPGPMKKGKSSKLAISVFLKHGEINEREKELIKAIPEEEVISAIVSNAKLSTPGLTSFLNSKKGGSARKVIDIEIADV